MVLFFCLFWCFNHLVVITTFFLYLLSLAFLFPCYFFCFNHCFLYDLSLHGRFLFVYQLIPVTFNFLVYPVYSVCFLVIYLVCIFSLSFSYDLSLPSELSLCMPSVIHCAILPRSSTSFCLHNLTCSFVFFSSKAFRCHHFMLRRHLLYRFTC